VIWPGDTVRLFRESDHANARLFKTARHVAGGLGGFAPRHFVRLPAHALALETQTINGRTMVEVITLQDPPCRGWIAMSLTHLEVMK